MNGALVNTPEEYPYIATAPTQYKDHIVYMPSQ